MGTSVRVAGGSLAELFGYGRKVGRQGISVATDPNPNLSFFGGCVQCLYLSFSLIPMLD